MQETLWHLRRCELFSQVAPDALQHIESRCRICHFSPQQVIDRPSETADCLFFLATGLVKRCHLTVDGKESILAFAEQGEVFGELALCDTGERSEYVVAVEPCTVLIVPVDEVRQLMTQQVSVAMRVTEMLARRGRRLERRLKNLLFNSNRQRLVHLLIELADQFGACCDAGLQLRIKLSHQELASMIGATRETVTMICGQLKVEGCIDYGRRRIVLTDLRRLSENVRHPAPSDQSRHPYRVPTVATAGCGA